jgi:hypothetical protein
MFTLAAFTHMVGWVLLGQVAADQPLIQESQLRYLGSFDIPMHGTWEEPLNTRFDYSMGIIGYREDRDALYVVTHAQDPTHVGLIKVPELSPSTRGRDVSMGPQPNSKTNLALILAMTTRGTITIAIRPCCGCTLSVH